MIVSIWRNAIHDLLRPLGVRDGRIAADLALNRGLLHQYFSGRCRPRPDVVRRINAAVADRVGTESTRRYLDAAAQSSGLLEIDDAERWRAGFAVFELVAGRLTPDLAARFDDAIEELAPTTRTTLLDALHRLHRKLLLDAIKGRVSHRVAFEQVRRVCEEHGFDFDRLLEQIENGTSEQMRLNANLRDAISQAFSTFFPDASAADRFRAHRTIEVAMTAYMEEHPIIAAVRQQGPRFVFTLRQAHQAGELVALVPLVQRDVTSRKTHQRGKKQKGSYR